MKSDKNSPIVNSGFLAVGKICGTHGIKGELKIQNFCDNFEVFCGVKNFYIKNSFQNEYIPINLYNFRMHKGFVLSFSDIIKSDGNKICKLNNRIIYAKKTDIPISDDRIFIKDLIGFQIIDSQDGRIYGVLKNIFNTYSNEIYEVESSKKIYYIPILLDTLKSFDLTKRIIYLCPLKGIFENDN